MVEEAFNLFFPGHASPDLNTTSRRSSGDHFKKHLIQNYFIPKQDVTPRTKVLLLQEKIKIGLTFTFTLISKHKYFI